MTDADSQLIAVVENVLEYLDDRYDVNDNGGPNEAMRLGMDLEAAQQRFLKEKGAVKE